MKRPMTIEDIANLAQIEALKNVARIKRKKPLSIWWRFNGSIDFSKYLRQSRVSGTSPNKLIVFTLWYLVMVAVIIAFLKIVFQIF